jgi:hypothetical protein
LSRFKNNFEAVLFHSLAYAFGLKINAEIFQQLAESLDFTVVQKIRQNREQLEALFYGTAGWLDDPKDHQSKRWIQEFQFLKSKFNLNNNLFQPRFLRLRPPNFPTLRLSQLAGLYHQEVHLFSKIMNAKKLDDLYAVFSNIKAFYGSVIAHYSCINQTFGSFFIVLKQSFSGLCLHKRLYLRLLIILHRILDNIRVRHSNSHVSDKR